jgi:hypothetical protein
MASVAESIYQIPVYDKIDYELLWTEELKYKTLERRSYADMADGRGRSLYKTKEDADCAFYRKNPEWFLYMVLGRKFLAEHSESQQFRFLIPPQVEFLDAGLDNDILKIGAVTNRGGAKSWLLGAESVINCATSKRAKESILAGSEKQAMKGAYMYARQMCEESAMYHTLVEDITKEEIKFYSGSVISNFASAETATRGSRATSLKIDEVTQAKEDVIESYLGQAITSPHFKIMWTGTPDKPQHMAHMLWWCNRPENVFDVDGKKLKVHHWIKAHVDPKLKPELNAKLSWHLFHWDAYDCHVDNGGWITDEAIEGIKSLYRTIVKQRREIYGLWTNDEGNILNTADVEAAIQKSAKDLPPIDKFNGIIVSIDGARHSHYSTIVCVGYLGMRAYVFYAKGWEQIKGKDMFEKICHVVDVIKARGGKNVHVIIESAPVSAGLIDDLQTWCVENQVMFQTSAFTHNKPLFVDRVCAYFETQTIEIPREYTQLIDELYTWCWDKNTNQKGEKTPAKGNDDFIDALMHNLMHDHLVKTMLGDMKLSAGAVRPEKIYSKFIQAFGGDEYDPFTSP